MIAKGMRVLFIAPKFFGYEQAIKHELELIGCDVDWYDDRPASSSFMKALIRFRPELVSTLSDAYFDRIIANARDYQYDVVFVIKGEAFSAQRIEQLRQSQPLARFLYYSWDSLANFKNSKEKFACFDKVYSFDRRDCQDNQVRHLPLFYVRAYEDLAVHQPVIQQDEVIDLLFLGSIHSDRYAVVQRIWQSAKRVMPQVKLFAYFFYQSRWVFLLRKIFDAQFRLVPWNDVEWNSLDTSQTLSLVARCKIMIDIHHPRQSGLTMRTIESLGAQKKIITTNPDVVNYDFYCPKNVLVVDRLMPVIPAEFIQSPYVMPDQSVYAKYSLRCWLNEIFS